MHLTLQTLIGQLPIGSLYALVGVGFVLVYRGTRVLNFAQGLLALLGGYIFYSLSSSLGLGFLPALVVAVLAAGLLGAAIYLVMLRPLMGQSALLIVMLTIALSILAGAVVLMAWGGGTLYPPNPYSQVITLPGSLTISLLNLLTIIVTVTVLGVLAVVLRFSSFGLSMRAVAEDPLLAAYRGVSVARISALTWAIGVGGASLAGVVYGMGSGLTPGSGDVLGYAAFPAVILGGLDSVSGALIGAFVLAEAQGFAITYLGGQYGDVVGYALLLVVLVIRPIGLFGSREVIRL